jgi:hypothetical protein
MTGYVSPKSFDYSFRRTRDNLFKVFGTKSYWAILSPSLRNNAFTGIEWTFQMKDLGYTEEGLLESSLDPEAEIQLRELEQIAEDCLATMDNSSRVHLESPEDDSIADELAI